MSVVDTFAVWVTVWCSACEEEWDVLMTPEQRSGEIEPDDEYVSCPECGRRGEWTQPSCWEDETP